MQKELKCATSDHIESIEQPGFCVWCGASMADQHAGKCFTCTECTTLEQHRAHVQRLLYPCPHCTERLTGHDPECPTLRRGAAPSFGPHPPTFERPPSLAELGVTSLASLDDVFSDLARSLAPELGALLKAVADGAILTLGPGTQRGDYAATLELPTNPRFAMVQDQQLGKLIAELAKKWERS